MSRLHADRAWLRRAGDHFFLSSGSYLCCSAKTRKGRKRLGWFNKQQGNQPCRSSPRRAEHKSNRLLRLFNTIVEARTRMYLEAVTDPATGRIDPALERQVLRM